MNIASYIDHTLLKSDATAHQIDALCKEAYKYNFASVCVNPFHVYHANNWLKNSEVKVCTVVGFPLGASETRVKVFETTCAIDSGADEIDIVMNIAAAKAGDWLIVFEELNSVAEICHANDVTLKVIIEATLLSKEEIARAAAVCSEAGADYVKTSTGFAGGASLEHISLIKQHIGKDVKIKASGGIKTYDFAKQLIEAGASRIGTSSGIQIIGEADQ
jgi:deoxyribose-phosphate aldolase